MKKTDESVKAGLGIRGAHEESFPDNKTTTGDHSTPIDGDEKIHEQEKVEVNPNEEQDYDEIVHQMPEGRDSTDDEDLDDKVHRISPDDEDRR